jgi:hypothetical protein
LQPDPPALGTEADDLRVAPRARRETLRPDVQRFQEVRLAGTVSACDEDDAGLERQLELTVGPEVSECEVADDQAVSQPALVSRPSQGAGSA